MSASIPSLRRPLQSWFQRMGQIVSDATSKMTSTPSANWRHRLRFNSQSLFIGPARRWFQKRGGPAETSSAPGDAREITVQNPADSPALARQQAEQEKSPNRQAAEPGPEPDIFDPAMMQSLFTRPESKTKESGEPKTVDGPDGPATVEASLEEKDAGGLESKPRLARRAASDPHVTSSSPAGPEQFVKNENASDQPLVRTMIETLESGRPGQEHGGANHLRNSLTEIFKKKQVADPSVKAMLSRHESVDIHTLAAELQDFARSIGAGRKDESN